MQASAVYTEGNISSTYRDIFEDVLDNINVKFDDYVFYRSGQYSYTLVVGDLEYANKNFRADEYTCYVISYSNSGYSSSTYTYTTSSGADFSLDVGNYVVYSNLGHYPNLIERDTYYGYATLYIIIVIGLCVVIRGIFKFTYRTRGGT